MNWARMLAYITGTVDQELLVRNEYLAAENRILKAQVKGRLLLSEADKTRSPNGEEGTRGAGDIKERKLNSLISGFEFPDKPLIIPCSIPSQDFGSGSRSYAN
jgi:hypothetical protein